jgi:two-component system sporulation sensor kinase A
MSNGGRVNSVEQTGGANNEFHHKTLIKQTLSLKELPAYILDWWEEHCSETISIWDESGNLLFISKSIETILGFKKEELIGTHWAEFIPTENAEKYFSLPEKIEKDLKPVFEVKLLDNHKKYVWCECKTDKIIDPQNLSVYYTAAIRDITDKKEVENMMVSYEKMSIAGQLAAGVAHEIRNPLTSLKGFLQLLQAGITQKEAYYKIMIDEIKKMEQITSELLYISKPLTDYRQEEDLSGMIKDIIELLIPQAKVKQIEIIDILQENIQLFCDRSQVKQVLINIVKNAIEAMEAPGRIKVKTMADGDITSIRVKDEGPGIDETIIHKLGEPFFTTKQNGTGLGLMVTKQILERHDGALKIYNNEKGSTFEIIFNHPDE